MYSQQATISANLKKTNTRSCLRITTYDRSATIGQSGPTRPMHHNAYPFSTFDAPRQSFRMEGFDRLSIDTSAQLDHTLRLKVILLTKNP